MTGTAMRARASEFFALDDDWVRVPGPGSRRKDLVLAVVLFLLSALGLEFARSMGGWGLDYPVWGEYLGLAATAAPVAARRRLPLAAASTASIAFFVVGVTMPAVAVQFSVQVLYFFALFSAMAWAADRRTALIVMGAVLVLMFGWLTVQFAVGSAIDSVNEAASSAHPGSGLFTPLVAAVFYTFLINVIYFGGAVLGGQAAWRAARRRAHLAEQARTLREQATELREHAVIQERLRIARELHDVVAHHVSVMGVQAGAARRVLASNPQAASTALASVEGSAREAVTEMRALLGTLRQGEPTETSSTSRAPEPSVGAIGTLVAQVAQDGLDVAYSVVEDRPGGIGEVTPAVGLTLYRTVQEALNNVRQHSTATSATVVLRVETRGPGRGGQGFAEVEILDAGRPRTGTSGTGLGLLGMRERVAHLDGSLEVGPRATGGFRVRARLPLVSQVAEDAAPTRQKPLREHAR